jgi:FtsH-binding integral membrane protein
MSIENKLDQTNSLRTALLDAEPMKNDRLRQLQDQIAQLSENRLSQRTRLWWSFGLGCSILFAVFGGLVAVKSQIDFPLRVVWWLYTTGNVFVVCFAATLLRRGRSDPRMFFWFGIVIATLAMGCLVSMLCRATVSSTMGGVIGVGFAEFCVVIDFLLLLYGRIVGAQRSTKEHLLRLELLLLD